MNQSVEQAIKEYSKLKLKKKRFEKENNELCKDNNTKKEPKVSKWTDEYRKEYQREYARQNKEYKTKYAALWRDKNREKYKEYQREYHKKMRDKNRLIKELTEGSK